MITNKRPLITFALFTFNQEKFIREAVQGALNQTYEPLEIIISDDSSIDSTHEIIEDIVRDYSGPHIIKLNRNEKNLGIGLHVSNIHKMSKGALIINAAGDDISLPDRVLKLYEAWTKASPQPSLLVSNGIRIDENGNKSTTLMDRNTASTVFCSSNPIEDTFPVIGCTVAIDKKLIDKFPSMLAGIMAEDVVLFRRAHLCNGVSYLSDILVLYRVHNMGVSQIFGKDSIKSKSKFLDFSSRWTKDRLLRYQQARADVLHISPKNDGEIFRSIELGEKNEQRRLRLIEGGFLNSVFACFSGVLLDKTNRKNILKVFTIRWLRLLTPYK